VRAPWLTPERLLKRHLRTHATTWQRHRHAGWEGFPAKEERPVRRPQGGIKTAQQGKIITGQADEEIRIG